MKKGCFILLFAFLFCSAAFAAQPDTETGLFEIPPAWQQTMDERFPDERMEKIYPNAIKVE